MNRTMAPNLKVHIQIEPAFSRQIRSTDLRRAVEVAFAHAVAERGELTLVVTDNEQIRELNRLYRHVDAATDVLSFGNQGVAEAIPTPSRGEPYYGDIIIAYPRAAEQAAEYGHAVEEELWLLTVHGTLHLLGYDHEQAEDREQMWRVQDLALETLGVPWRP